MDGGGAITPCRDEVKSNAHRFEKQKRIARRSHR